MSISCGSAIGGREAATILLLVLITSSDAAAQTFSPDLQAAAVEAASGSGVPSHEPGLPSNLIVPDIVRSLVTTMWRQSPTFRRQCGRLAEQPNVTVRFELAQTVRDTTGARSSIERSSGRLSASVEIEFRKPERFVEHIAHELEHVLEHMDGIDLPRLARQGLDGVMTVRTGFETARARTVGRLVAREAMIR